MKISYKNGNTKKIFAGRLRYIRQKMRKLTQRKLADISGIPATSISHFENPKDQRKPSFDNIISLSLALDVTTDYLLTLSDTPIAAPEPMNSLYRDIKFLTYDDKALAKSIIKKIMMQSMEKAITGTNNEE